MLTERFRILQAVVAAVVLAASNGCSSPDASSRDDDLTLEPAGVPTRFPIVLEHGFNASASIRGFQQVKAALEADGHAVFIAEVPPFASVETRSEKLAEIVDSVLSTTGAAKVDIIAHSMGGLDARALVSTRGYGDRVAAIATISTPHRGTAMADLALHFIHGPIEDAVDFLAEAMGERMSDARVAANPDFREALVDLAEKSADAFNAAHPDDPRVYYESWAGVSSRVGIGNDDDVVVCEGMLPAGRTDIAAPTFTAISLVVGHGLGGQNDFRPNDGLVTVASAKWGNFRGCERADHFGVVGDGTRRSGFDGRRFLRSIAFGLSARGY